MKSLNRATIIAIIYYLIVFPLVLYCNLSGKFRSGPCGPDLDVLSGFMAFIASLVLCVVTGLLHRRYEKYLYAFLIHSAAIAGWILLFIML